MAESIAVEHHLGLFIRASHDVPNSPEGSGLDAHKKHFLRNILKYMSSKACPGGASRYLNFDLLMTQQRNQMWDDAGVNDHLYLLVPCIGQVRQSPHRVDQDLQETKKSRRFFSAVWTNLGI